VHLNILEIKTLYNEIDLLKKKRNEGEEGEQNNRER